MRDLPSEILTTYRKTWQCRSLYYTKGPLSWTGVIIRRRRKEGEIEGGKEIKGSGWMEGWLGWDGAADSVISLDLYSLLSIAPS